MHDHVRAFDDWIERQPRAREKREPECRTAEQRVLTHASRKKSAQTKYRVQQPWQNSGQKQSVQPHGSPERKKHHEEKQPAAKPLTGPRQGASKRMSLNSIFPRFKCGELPRAIEPARARDGRQRRQSSNAETDFPGQ